MPARLTVSASMKFAPEVRLLSLTVAFFGLFALAGCQLFEQPVATATQPLGWLTNWGGEDDVDQQPIDISILRPSPQPAEIEAGDLLEITVSSLFKPEEPNTFQSRVQADGTISVPFLDNILVQGQSGTSIESLLTNEYLQQDLLVDPKVVVRNLEIPQVKVFVEGAVERPGMVSLPREDASVYSALVAAGGLKSNAGGHLSLTRQSMVSADPRAPYSAAQFSIPHDHPQTANQTNSEEGIPSGPPISTANPPRSLTLTPPLYINGRDANDILGGEPAAYKTAYLGVTGDTVQPEVVWFDAQNEGDLQALVELRLVEGDVLFISEVVPPVRVLGAVHRSGEFNIPNSEQVTLLHVLQRAGGAIDSDEPLHVFVARPAISGRGAKRWSMDLASLVESPEEAPIIQPGDIVHVQHSTGSKLKQAVGGWLGK